jgi:predicted ATPase with chaperone activity
VGKNGVDEAAETADEAEEDLDSQGPWRFVPPPPMTVAATGIPEPFLRELVLKTLWAYDKSTLASVAGVIGLHVRVVEDLINGLQREGLCDVDSGSAVAGVQFYYRLTDRGKVAAHEALQRSRYVGVAPIPVSAYNLMIKEQIKRFKRPPLAEIRKALAHLVLDDRLIEVLGQAFFSRRALMVFGPSGNGKTDIVTSIANTVVGTVLIPHALFGHGQLIRVFDPDIHKSLVSGDEDSGGVWANEALRHDRRWLPVSRPTVLVGGELGADALEMTYDPTQGVHNAPLSIVAQGGVLVIDDLGRQSLSPREILNRWVIMMEQGYDSFALSSSEIVRLPLDVTLVFSTNLTLYDLMDEAYLRRIAYKIAVPNPNREQLAEITRRFCTRAELQWSEEAVEYLMDRLFAPGLPPPRGCYPRDIITTVMDEAEFHGRDPVIDKDSIEAALNLYLGTGEIVQRDVESEAQEEAEAKAA